MLAMMNYADFTTRLLPRLGGATRPAPEAEREQCAELLSQAGAPSEDAFEKAGDVAIELLSDSSTHIGSSVVNFYRNRGYLNEPQPLPRVEATYARLRPFLDTEVDFHVLRSEAVNAQSNVDGQIFLTEGLLAQVQDENVLAFVLAHEIAHCEHHDPLRYRGFKMLSGLMGGLAGTVAVNELQHAEMRDLEVAADARAKELLLKAGFELEPVARWMAEWNEEDDLHPPAARRIEALLS